MIVGDNKRKIEAMEGTKMKNKHTGSSFEDWLNEEGMLEEVDAAVTKRIIVRQIEQAISEKKISKAEMARRIKTSRLLYK